MIRCLLTLLCCLTVNSVWAEGTSTTHLWAPSRPLVAEGHSIAGGALGCYAWVANQGIMNATGIDWWLTVGMGAAQLCSMSVYTGNGGLQVATTGPVDCSTSGKIIVTGLTPFSLAAGNKYQICTCGTAAGSFLATDNGALGALADLRNLGATIPLVAAAANPCPGAVAPPTTGVLTGVAITPWYVRFTTSTP